MCGWLCCGVSGDVKFRSSEEGASQSKTKWEAWRSCKCASGRQAFGCLLPDRGTTREARASVRLDLQCDLLICASAVAANNPLNPQQSTATSSWYNSCSHVVGRHPARHSQEWPSSEPILGELWYPSTQARVHRERCPHLAERQQGKDLQTR